MARLELMEQALQNARAAGRTSDAQALQQAIEQAKQEMLPALSQAYYNATQNGNTDDAKAMLTYLSQHGMALLPMNAQQREAAFQRVNAQNVADQPGVITALQGFGKDLVNTGRGIGQMLGMVSPQDVAESRRLDQALSSSNAGALGGLVSQASQTLAAGGALGAGAKAVGLAGRAVPYLTSALAGGAFAGAQPVAPGESRAVNAALGFGLGAAGEAIPPGLRVLAGKASPALSLAKREGIAAAEKYGIPLHLSQVTDSRPLQTLASAAKYLPFAGNTAARRAQQGAFNRALSRQIGENTDEITDKALTDAANRIGQGYDALFGRNNVRLTHADARKLANIINEANRLGGSEAGRVVGNHVDDVLNALDSNGAMPGRLYQSIRTDQLLPAERNAAPSAQHYLRKVRKLLQDAADRSMQGGDAQELARLNSQYRSLRTIEKAMKRAGGASGDVSPASLWSLVNGRYGATPEMRSLAKLGQTVLKDPIPDSGTASRNIIYRALTTGLPGLFTLPPLALAGATIGRGLNSQLATKLLPGAGKSALLGLAKGTQPAPYLLPLLAPPIQHAERSTVLAGGPE